MRFSLTIRMGNAAMEAPGDVARALAALAERLQEHDGFDTSYLPVSGIIRDDNGNTVGEWATGDEALQRLAALARD